jgi:hypothetical protein
MCDKLRWSTRQSPFRTTETPLGPGLANRYTLADARPVGNGNRMAHLRLLVFILPPDGRPSHPDTITRRFKKLAAAAGLPEIDLHDVRTAMPPQAGARRSTGRR